MKKIVEVCCGSYYDALQASLGGAQRIELNTALYMGGLTPSMATLLLTKRETDLKVISMLRPRGGGFCYSPEDFKTMYFDCQMMMKHGSDGIAFGCLKADATVDLSQTKMIVEAIKEKGGEAVFHRAFDCVKDPYGTMEQLIELGVDRVLTSGQAPKAPDGAELLAELQERFGDRIELLAGSGVNLANARELIQKTGISQVHSSCKDWLLDPTTVNGSVSYGYAGTPNEACFDVVSADMVRELIKSVEAPYVEETK